MEGGGGKTENGEKANTGRIPFTSSTKLCRPRKGGVEKKKAGEGPG